MDFAVNHKFWLNFGLDSQNLIWTFFLTLDFFFCCFFFLSLSYLGYLHHKAKKSYADSCELHGLREWMHSVGVGCPLHVLD